MQRDDASAHALKRDAGKAGRPHHFGKRMRGREAADGFDQIPVRLGIADDGASKRGNHVEGVKVIKRIEAGHVDGGEFQAQEPPADPQDTIGFLERGFDARHVANAEGDGDGIITVVGER